MNKIMPEQMEPYNDLTRELFFRGKYVDNFTYSEGKITGVKKGNIDRGQYIQLNYIEKNHKIITANTECMDVLIQLPQLNGYANKLKERQLII